MKCIRHQIGISFFLLIIMSCKKDFLDVPDKTTIFRQAYVTDLKTTNDFLNGIYVQLGSQFYTNATISYPDLVADDVKAVSFALTSPYNWQQLADNDNATSFYQFAPNCNGLWFSGYKVIHDCSFILETVDKYRKENSEKADNIKGQAYVIRALVHSVLVNVFAQSYNFTPTASHAGVPYITASDWSKPVSRNTVAEVYQGIISDLNNAIQLLSQDSKDTRFISRNAAKALLARIYLFKGEYLAAKDLAVEVATAVPIMPGENYPSKLFTLEETEALFQLPPAATGVVAGAGSYDTYFPGTAFTSTPFFKATEDISSILNEDARDARHVWVTKADDGWNITKYPADVIPGFPDPNASYYQTILRSSELVLTAAEAYAMLSKEDSARFYLDIIRKRANPLALSSTAMGPALLDAIYKERRKEFAFEGFRMFDLLRWKKGVKRQDAVDASAQNLPYPSDKAIAPIPLQDVQLSGLAQNTGY